MSPVTTRRENNASIISVNNPPVNALSHAVRKDLDVAFRNAFNDPETSTIILICEGRTFFAGADISEFGKPRQPPPLPDLIDMIESSPKPVIAAIHGGAFGGGLEVALGCHYRIASQSAKLGLPEVTLGLIPGAGGTQRLPRLIGVKESLPIIMLGTPIAAEKAKELGLVDKISTDSTLENDALAFADAIAAKPVRPVTSARVEIIESPEAADAAIRTFTEQNAKKLRGLTAPVAGIEALKAAAREPYEVGKEIERDLFRPLVDGDQSKALRHVFFAQRAAAKIEGVDKDTPAHDVKTVGILGAGTMGGGIAMNFLTAGLPVTIIERDDAALERGVNTIRKNYEASAKKGKFTNEQVEQYMALLTPSLTFDAIADHDLVIEAVFEEMDLKRDVFRHLDKTVKPGAILASNTSYLNIDEMAKETARPENVIGLHFFSPANVMKLLEVVRGAKTSPAVLKTAMALARKIGKVAVVSGVCDGFIGNRMLSQRQDQARALILQGPRPWDVDRVLTEFGFPMGPFQMSDLAGLDIGWNAETSSSASVHEILCERGRRGQKTGKGYYDYDDNRRRSPSPETEEIIDRFIAANGVPRRDIDDDEIRARLLYPMVNEGAKILQEGIAQRASDIDIVWLNGYGWPAWTGGPMFWADTIGLDRIVDGLRKFQIEPAPFLRSKAESGHRFTD